jgi:hypothetical protein
MEATKASQKTRVPITSGSKWDDRDISYLLQDHDKISSIHTLWWFNIAIEHGGSFHSYVNVYQRVHNLQNIYIIILTSFLHHSYITSISHIPASHPWKSLFLTFLTVSKALSWSPGHDPFPRANTPGARSPAVHPCRSAGRSGWINIPWLFQTSRWFFGGWCWIHLRIILDHIFSSEISRNEFSHPIMFHPFLGDVP